MNKRRDAAWLITPRGTLPLAAMALLLGATMPAGAGTPAASPQATPPQLTAAAATDFSAARRHRPIRRGRGDAAAAAAFAGIVGTIGAIAAAQAERDAYYDGPYGYYDGPVYGRPYYGPVYGRPYYRGYGYGRRFDGGGNIIP